MRAVPKPNIGFSLCSSSQTVRGCYIRRPTHVKSFNLGGSTRHPPRVNVLKNVSCDRPTGMPSPRWSALSNPSSGFPLRPGTFMIKTEKPMCIVIKTICFIWVATSQAIARHTSRYGLAHPSKWQRSGLESVGGAAHRCESSEGQILTGS